MAKIIFWNTFQGNTYSFLLRPPGPHLLAGWLTQHGHSAKVIDFCSYLNTDHLVELTEKYISTDTVAIGVSTTFWKKLSTDGNRDFNKDNKIVYSEPDWVISARLIIQSKYPNLKWLLGGGGNFASTNFDWIKIYGHAEDAICKFLDENSKSKFDIYNQIGCFTYNSSIMPSEFLSIELARGCQFKCKFCTYPLIGKKKGTYLRNMEHVYNEFLYNYNEFGITRYSIVDDTVNESVEKIQDLASIADKLPFKLEWVGYNRLDLIYANPHTAELLKRSGLIATFFGMESFDPEASKCVGKGWVGKHGKDYLEKIAETWNNEINISVQFIVGLPKESMQSIWSTHEWLVQTSAVNYWQFSPLHLNRNLKLSEFDKNYKDYGIKFPHPLKDRYWEHEEMNYFTATELAQNLNNNNNRLDKINPFNWSFPGLLMYGDSYKSTANLKNKDIHLKLNIDSKAKNFIDNYFTEQLKLKSY